MEGSLVQDDINRLIASNTGLVYKQLKQFHLARDPEAESIGYEALYNAVLDFDSSKGTKLSTLATVYIYNALGSYVRTQNKQRQLEVISYNNIAYSEDGTDHEFVDFIPTPSNVEQDFMKKELNKIVREEVKHLSAHLAPYKRPLNIIVYKKELPKTTTRKVKRREVKQLLNL